MIMLLRNIHISNKKLHADHWQKLMGQQFSEVNIGILGAGRIGGEVIRLLSAFGPKQIYGCEINPHRQMLFGANIKWVPIDELFRRCRLVSLHVPLGKDNHHLIDGKLISLMDSGSLIINTSRGALVDEYALHCALTTGSLSGAAIDVFETEPYSGSLTQLDNVIISPHVSSMTMAARDKMEVGAVTDCLRVLQGKTPIEEVPHEVSL